MAAAIGASFFGLATPHADRGVDTVTPDPPARRDPPTLAPATFQPTWDLDGFYLWLGPVGAASHVDGDWDSIFGADLSFVQVRERAALSAIGASVGASMWTARDGGRLWLDVVAGTRLGGRIVGVTVGPLLELADMAHPRVGGSVGIWGFAGITPFARAGVIDELGAFGEIGVHIALPVWRH